MTKLTLKEAKEMMDANGGYLDLEGTGITALPDGLSVGGSLNLEGTGIPLIFKDERGYELRMVKVGNEIWYVAGCRTFKSKEEALAHWGGSDYPDPERGKSFCDAIEKASAE